MLKIVQLKFLKKNVLARINLKLKKSTRRSFKIRR